MYGSIFIDVTAMPQQSSRVPNELAITPFPTPLITPPVTKMYFIVFATCVELLNARRIKRLHINLLLPRRCVKRSCCGGGGGCVVGARKCFGISCFACTDAANIFTALHCNVQKCKIVPATSQQLCGLLPLRLRYVLRA